MKPREHTYPLYIKLKLLNVKTNKYLLSRLMFRIRHGDITMLDGYFIRNSNIHDYNTRQTDHTDHYHVPSFKTNLGKACFKHQGELIWNNILKHEIDINVSDHLFVKNIYGLILQKCCEQILAMAVLIGNCYHCIIRHTMQVVTSCVLNRLISRRISVAT